MSERERELTISELTKDDTLYFKVFGNENEEDFQSQLDNLTLKDFVNIFQVKDNHPEYEGDKLDDLKLYYINEFVERETKKSIQNEIASIPGRKIFKTVLSSLQRKRGDKLLQVKEKSVKLMTNVGKII